MTKPALSAMESTEQIAEILRAMDGGRETFTTGHVDPNAIYMARAELLVSRLRARGYVLAKIAAKRGK